MSYDLYLWAEPARLAQHHRVFIDSLDQAAAAFRGFAGGDAAWKSAHSWTLL
jgi:hypothetical protein